MEIIFWREFFHQGLVRSGFRVLLQTAADFEVVGEVGDGQQAIEQARRLRPDVVLMDVRMPVIDVRDRVQLAVFAYDSGLVRPRPS